MKQVKLVCLVGGRAWFGVQYIIDLDDPDWMLSDDGEPIGADELIKSVMGLDDDHNMVVGNVDEIDYITWLGGDDRDDEGRAEFVRTCIMLYGDDQGTKMGDMFDVVLTFNHSECNQVQP